tara:strand:+ start:87 stop:320 length:234 start_codon:yes stop_codon:yes gene_type:complete
MGQRCCKVFHGTNTGDEKIQAKAAATTSPLAPEPASKVAAGISMQHPHRSLAGDLITTSRARKLDIREAAIEDYVHL